ncbi:hypothetical protein SLA2020_308310 [Shorea laevis]
MKFGCCNHSLCKTAGDGYAKRNTPLLCSSQAFPDTKLLPIDSFRHIPHCNKHSTSLLFHMHAFALSLSLLLPSSGTRNWSLHDKCDVI